MGVGAGVEQRPFIFATNKSLTTDALDKAMIYDNKGYEYKLPSKSGFALGLGITPHWPCITISCDFYSFIEFNQQQPGYSKLN